MLFHQGFHEECGVFGIVQHKEAANLAYLGIHALQHRGQESAGIVTTDGNELLSHRGMGLVADVFNHDSLSRLTGKHCDRTCSILHSRLIASEKCSTCRCLLLARAAGAVA